MKILLTLFIATVLINIAEAQNVPIAAYNQDLLQKDTRFIFPGYVIKVHDFNVFNEENGFGRFNYNGDTSQVILSDTGEVTTIRVKKDSISINEDPASNLESSIIEIIPRNRSDSFKLYYTYPIHLLELVAEKSYDIDNLVPVSSFSGKSVAWKGSSNYKSLTPQVNHFYPIPRSDISFYQRPGGWMYEEIKTRLHLKEKTMLDQIAHIQIQALIYQNKSCILWPDGIYFRIERYVNGKYKSTKYLLIKYEDYE